MEPHTNSFKSTEASLTPQNKPKHSKAVLKSFIRLPHKTIIPENSKKGLECITSGLSPNRSVFSFEKLPKSTLSTKKFKYKLNSPLRKLYNGFRKSKPEIKNDVLPSITQKHTSKATLAKSIGKSRFSHNRSRQALLKF